VWDNQVDLNEQQDCILNSGDWRHVSVARWQVREVELPEWLSPKEWIAEQVAWKYTWGLGVDPEWDEAWQRGLLRMSSEHTLACVSLLKVKNFRSEFRQSLRTQLETWLTTPFDERKHSDPFSPRQWDCLLTPRLHREAKQISTALYRSR